MSTTRSVLIPVSGPLENLTDSSEAATALQGPSYTVNVARGVVLTCTSGPDQVNWRASKLAGFAVQGDAALCMQLDQDIGFAEYLEERKFRLSCSGGKRGSSSSRAAAGPAPAPSGKGNCECLQDGQEAPQIDLQQHDHLSAWAELPQELLIQIVKGGMTLSEAQEKELPEAEQGFDLRTGNSGALLAATGVCRGWRSLILGSDEVLKGARVYINSTRPFVGALYHTPPQMIRKIKCPPLPLAVTRAAALGNGSAAFAAGALLDLQGQGDTAVRFWRRAAKSGFRKAQLRIGEAFYRGSNNMPRDAEEALMWLNRTVRGLEEKPTQPCIVAASACLLLGFLYFDGEGVTTDQEEAVRFFRRAAAFGSKEAEKTLGWIYNTGQYGTLTRWG